MLVRPKADRLKMICPGVGVGVPGIDEKSTRSPRDDLL